MLHFRAVRRIAVLSLVSLASMGGIALGQTAPPATANIQVADAWIRWLPAGVPGAAYMSLTNSGSQEQVLVGADSPDYAEIGIHRTHSHEGMSAMMPVASIVLKPHATVRFAEGGYHLMLMRPKRALKPGDRVMITFRFEDGGTVTVPFEIRGGAAQ